MPKSDIQSSRRPCLLLHRERSGDIHVLRLKSSPMTSRRQNKIPNFNIDLQFKNDKWNSLTAKIVCFAKHSDVRVWWDVWVWVLLSIVPIRNYGSFVQWSFVQVSLNCALHESVFCKALLFYTWTAVRLARDVVPSFPLDDIRIMHFVLNWIIIS